MVERKPLLLVQFAREPVPGEVKTRMMPHLSPEEACELHCELTLWALEQLRSVGSGDIELSVAGDSGHTFFSRCGDASGITLSEQADGDLGERMFVAISRGLLRYEQVILIGSDCPGIDQAYILAAAAALKTHGVVLGPALDGGYVLIGARTVRRQWFEGISWGSGAVYAQTQRALNKGDVHWAALAALGDIDRPDDLTTWHAIRAAAGL